MPLRAGGETPANYGQTMTVEAPTGTSATVPVEVGDVFELVVGTAYKITTATNNAIIGNTAIADAAKVLVRAEERAEAVKPMTVRILNGKYSQVLRMPYSGAAPTVGQSIAADGAKKIKAIAFDGNSFVCFTDAAKVECEVLL